MTTRFPGYPPGTTQADIDGTSARGRAEFEARQERLRELGIKPREKSIYDVQTPEEAGLDALEALDAELKDIERADAKATKPDLWVWRDGAERSH